MVVQHNLTAMNSNRMLGITTGTQAKSTEKLSSGYKINRAADDAAGLSISEKMRKQIRGLTQASLNAEDGISAVQTAEGALNEVQDMLQRMNELAVKAANGTMSENDRSYIQDEIDQLVTEIDRVAETTKFNETYLLKGDPEKATLATDLAATAVTGLSANTTIAATEGTVIEDGQKILLGTIEKVVYNVTDKDTTLAITKTGLKATDDVENGTYTFKTKVDDDVEKDGWYSDTTGKYEDGITGGANLESGDTLEVGHSFTANANTGNFTADTTDYTAVAMDDATGNTENDALAVGNVYAYAKVDNGTVTFSTEESVPDALKLSLQVGADTTAENKIELEIDSMSAASLGIKGLRVDGANSTNADKSVDTIAAALQQVSTQRSALGAVQNRLEHTIANLDNVVENTTAAESQIRDTDMATEMVKYSNNNILAQAGQAMLAQANQANQGVLSLLG